jgi:molybdopterin/thiamine biosynthesis adenylyltransferase
MMQLIEDDNRCEFNYENAFSRNLGWLNEDEQKLIRSKVIAIPGMGGVGGHHIHSLLRVGFCKFKIADFDQFDVHNFNRQIGSSMDTLGRSKCEVMLEMARSINPEAEIEVFNEGITENNQFTFLKDVEILVDGLDVYQLDMRISLYELAHKNGIPVISAAPLGMGTSVLAFDPNGMSFNEYNNLRMDLSDDEKFVRFLAGMAPKPIHLKYLKYKEYINPKEGKVPSLHMGCLAATTALSSICTKITISRGKMLWAPRGYQIDFFRNKMTTFWRPFGNRNPIQRILISVLKRMIKKNS